jgi:hypothetical protein
MEILIPVFMREIQPDLAKLVSARNANYRHELWRRIRAVISEYAPKAHLPEDLPEEQ